LEKISSRPRRKYHVEVAHLPPCLATISDADERGSYLPPLGLLAGLDLSQG
jgi:hypothetical protein